MPFESFKPCLNFVIIKEFAEPGKTAGGIILSDYSERHFKIGVAKAVGPGRYKDSGIFIPNRVRPGDITIAPIGAGYEMYLDQGSDSVSDMQEFRLMEDWHVWARAKRTDDPPSECPLVPIDDRIIVMQDADADTIGDDIVRPDGTVVRLLLPDQAKERKRRSGTVLAVGAGHPSTTGVIIPIDLQVGQKVFWSEYAGIEVEYEEQKFVIISELNVLTSQEEALNAV